MSSHIPTPELALHDNAPGFSEGKTQGFVATITTLSDDGVEVGYYSAGALPERYKILDLSGELRARQHEAVARGTPHLAGRVGWLDTLPESFSGMVVANELPVNIVAWRKGGIFERGVTQGDSGFAWLERPAPGKRSRRAFARFCTRRPPPRTLIPANKKVTKDFKGNDDISLSSN